MVKKEVYDKYKRVTNMTYSELFRWSKGRASILASVDRKPIMRNLRLLRKPFKKWTARDEADANKTIAFIARMKKVPRGKQVVDKYTKRDIALKNWAFNPFK